MLSVQYSMTSAYRRLQCSFRVHWVGPSDHYISKVIAALYFYFSSNNPGFHLKAYYDCPSSLPDRDSAFTQPRSTFTRYHVSVHSTNSPVVLSIYATATFVNMDQNIYETRLAPSIRLSPPSTPIHPSRDGSLRLRRSPAKQPIHLLDEPGPTLDQILNDDSLTASQKDLAHRVAHAAKRVQDWHKELEHWKWTGSFDREVYDPEVGTDDGLHTADGDTWLDEHGSISSSILTQYEATLDHIHDELPHLDLDDLKERILELHQNNSRPSSRGSNITASSLAYLDDYSFFVTRTLIRILPASSSFRSRLKTWSARISVFHHIPKFMQNYRLARIHVKTAWQQLENDIQSPLSEEKIDEEQKHLDIVRGNTHIFISGAGNILDVMLDLLEDQEDLLPENWIDVFERLEAEFSNWCCAAQRRIFGFRIALESATHSKATQEPNFEVKEVDIPNLKTTEAPAEGRGLTSASMGPTVDGVPRERVPAEDATIASLEQTSDTALSTNSSTSHFNSGSSKISAIVMTDPPDPNASNRTIPSTFPKQTEPETRQIPAVAGNAMSPPAKVLTPPTLQLLATEHSKPLPESPETPSSLVENPQKIDDHDVLSVVPELAPPEADDSKPDGQNRTYSSDLPHTPVLEHSEQHQKQPGETPLSSSSKDRVDRTVQEIPPPKATEVEPEVLPAANTEDSSMKNASTESLADSSVLVTPFITEQAEWEMDATKLTIPDMDATEISRSDRVGSPTPSEGFGDYSLYEDMSNMSVVSEFEEPDFEMDDSPSHRKNRVSQMPQPPLNAMMRKKRGDRGPRIRLTTFTDDKDLITSTPQYSPLPSAEKTGSSPFSPVSPVLPLEQQISNILDAIPTPIRLRTGPKPNAPEVKRNRLRTASAQSRRPSIQSRSATPSLTLAPADESSSRRSNSSGPDIRLYHLIQTGQDKPIKLFIRRVGENGERVMVRVGGGWADLAEYLRIYAEHHGRRAVSDGRIEIQALGDKANVTPKGSESRRATLVNGYSRSNTPTGDWQAEQDSATSTPRLAFETPQSVASAGSRRSLAWDEVGLAGPKTKRGEMSEEKKEWVDAVVEQAKRSMGKSIEVGDLGKSGGTRRIFFKGRKPSGAE
ncbi:hypothetical protein BT63DRAFT_479812 [Microthyrium microscopicum]|uniref:GAR domain-containing protein n=1 Tax=Microthyrium microscopicum TaxID=703497 RepID=A0A6A6U814_9PEZI|nr:hypothetical protein BT63DRAFT_479812 [Microthyrium microscopicum]